MKHKRDRRFITASLVVINLLVWQNASHWYGEWSLKTLAYAKEYEAPQIEQIELIQLRGDATPEVMDAFFAAAEKHGADPTVMSDIIWAETKWRNEQSRLRYTFTDPSRGIVKGERERSYCYAQIHLPDHTEYTEEELSEPEVCFGFLAKEVARGNTGIFYAYKN